jgi:uncharacterized protein YbjT (DUF2867 family)
MFRRSILGFVVVLASAVLAACAGTGGTRNADAPVVLVAGATGGTGQHVVQQALAKGYRVRALVRDPAKARMLWEDRVEYAVGDVREPRTLRRAVRGVDYVISAVGASTGQRDPENSPELVDYAGVKALAEAARAANVEQFVLVSSMGVTQPDHQLNRSADNILQWKLKGEEAVRATGLHYTIVRPGQLTNEPGGAGVRVMQGDTEDMSARISRADLANVLINCLGRQDLYGRTFEIAAEAGSLQNDWTRLLAGLKPDSPQDLNANVH